MITRRELILFGVGGTSLLATLPAWASDEDFWKTKKPADWSQGEVQRLLTKSPWAKEVKAEMDMAGMTQRMGGGGLGGGRTGIPGGGGPPGGMGGQPRRGRPEFKAIVRWETALPVRDVTRQKKTFDSTGYYVISVSGMPTMTAGRGEIPGSGRGEKAPSDENQEALLKETTQLQRKGKDPLHPARVEVSRSDGSTLFFFRREEPITLQEKEVVFVTRMGPLKVKTKFPLKNMMYQGQLEL